MNDIREHLLQNSHYLIVQSDSSNGRLLPQIPTNLVIDNAILTRYERTCKSLSAR